MLCFRSLSLGTCLLLLCVQVPSILSRLLTTLLSHLRMILVSVSSLLADILIQTSTSVSNIVLAKGRALLRQNCDRCTRHKTLLLRRSASTQRSERCPGSS